MNYSTKHTLLSSYLDVPSDEIIELSPSSYEYNGDEYMILDENELDGMIEDQVKWTADEVQHAIDLGQDNIDYCYYISMEVDRESIKEDIEDNLGDYIGTGTYEKFEGYYIFLMQ
jgi:hypothetical protein